MYTDEHGCVEKFDVKDIPVETVVYIHVYGLECNEQI